MKTGISSRGGLSTRQQAPSSTASQAEGPSVLLQPPKRLRSLSWPFTHLSALLAVKHTLKHAPSSYHRCTPTRTALPPPQHPGPPRSPPDPNGLHRRETNPQTAACPPGPPPLGAASLRGRLSPGLPLKRRRHYRAQAAGPCGPARRRHGDSGGWGGERAAARSSAAPQGPRFESPARNPKPGFGVR